jgi:hypothetical protein
MPGHDVLCNSYEICKPCKKGQTGGEYPNACNAGACPKAVQIGDPIECSMRLRLPDLRKASDGVKKSRCRGGPRVELGHYRAGRIAKAEEEEYVVI